MNKNKLLGSTVLLGALLMASACQKKAEGQVVAVVNGEEITLNELNAELSELNLPPAADKKQVRAQLLQKMIDRRLLAQAAKEAGIDRDPAYVSQQRRLDEQLLVSMYGKKALDTVRVPDTVTVDQFISSHPAMFANRTRYKLDQLQFDVPPQPQRLKELETAHTLEEVATRLTAMGIKFERGNGSLDSATLPPEVMSRIQALPAGEPFIVPNGGKIIVNVITGSDSVTLPADKARPLAVQQMRSESLNKIGEQRLGEARAKAKIEYQPGYEAPKAAPAAAKPAAS